MTETKLIDPEPAEHDGNKYWVSSEGKPYRPSGGPTFVGKNDTQYWQDQEFRPFNASGGPTFIVADGTKVWHDLDGKMHRDNDLPALITPGGGRVWRHHGKIHRDNGQPAVIGEDGQVRYFYQDIEFFPAQSNVAAELAKAKALAEQKAKNTKT